MRIANISNNYLVRTRCLVLLALAAATPFIAADDASPLRWGDPRSSAAEEAFILAGRDPPLLERPLLAGRLRRELLDIGDPESSRIAEELKPPPGHVAPSVDTTLGMEYSNRPNRDEILASALVFDDSTKPTTSSTPASVFRSSTPNDRVFHSTESMSAALAVPAVLDLRLRLLIDPAALDIDPEIRAASNSYRNGSGPSLNYGLFADLSKVDVNVPYRGIAAFLSGPFELRAGRDKLQLGPGRASTLSFNAAIPWANYAKASVDAGPLSLSWYYVSLNPYLTDDERRYLSAIYDLPTLAVDYNTNYYELIHTEAEKNLAICRLTWRINPWATVVFTQNDLVAGRSMQLSDLNPLIIWHNLFQEGAYGVPAMLEASMVPLPGLRLYGQYLLYDAVVADEVGSSTENAGASAYQAGLSWLIKPFSPAGPLAGTRLRLDAEATLTDPWVYGKAYSLRQFTSRFVFVEPSSEERVWVDYPIGPAFGPDCADLDLRLGLGRAEGWEIAATGGYRESGSITLMGYGLGSDYAHQASFHRDGLAYVASGQSSERRLRLGLEGASPPLRLGPIVLKGRASIQGVWVRNFRFVPGATASWVDAALSVSASYGATD